MFNNRAKEKTKEEVLVEKDGWTKKQDGKKRYNRGAGHQRKMRGCEKFVEKTEMRHITSESI